PRVAQIVTARHIRHFNRRQGTIENAEVVHLAALESGVTKAVTDGQVRLASFVSDVFAELVTNDLDLDRRAIDEDADARRAARSIVCEGDVNPLVRRKGCPAPNLERIARPQVMKSDGDAPVLQQQLVTATAGVDGRFGVVKHDLTGGGTGGLQPKREREWIDPRKMSDARKGEAVVAVELRRLSIPAF